jgi:excisionase family DNA binding protein
MPSKKPASDELISLAEASQRCGLSVSYLRTIAESGRLQARKIGRNWVTTSSAVEAYLKSRAKKGAYRAELKI